VVGALAIVLLGFGALLLFLGPTIVAFQKNHPQKVAIALVNILGGFLYGIGWLVALVWCYSEPRDRAGGAVSVAAHIRELHELKEQGILTQDEFEAKKRTLLEAGRD